MTALLEVPQPLLQAARKYPEHSYLVEVYEAQGGIPLPISSDAVEESLRLVATVINNGSEHMSVRKVTLSFVKNIVDAGFESSSVDPELPPVLNTLVRAHSALDKSVGYRKGSPPPRTPHPLLSNDSVLQQIACEALPASSPATVCDTKSNIDHSLSETDKVPTQQTVNAPVSLSDEAKSSETLEWRQQHSSGKTVLASSYNQRIAINTAIRSDSSNRNTVSSSFRDQLQSRNAALEAQPRQGRDTGDALEARFLLLDERLELKTIMLEGEMAKKFNTSLRKLRNSVKALQDTFNFTTDKLEEDLTTLTSMTVPSLRTKIDSLEDQVMEYTPARKLQQDLDELSDAVDLQASTASTMQSTLNTLVEAVDNLRIQTNEIEQTQAISQSVKRVSNALMDVREVQAKLLSLNQRVYKLEQNQSNKSEEDAENQHSGGGPASVLEVETEFERFFIMGNNDDSDHIEDHTSTDDPAPESEASSSNPVTKPEEAVTTIITQRFTIM